MTPPTGLLRGERVRLTALNQEDAPIIARWYRDTALLLVTDECAGYCRYCFRKRHFFDSPDEARRDCGPGLEYIREHPEITDVLLTGGDPLTLSTGFLGEIVESLLEMEHVHTIRIGSKTPAYDPQRHVLWRPHPSY